MAYVLGLDVGTSRTVVALCRRAGAAWDEADVAGADPDPNLRTLLCRAGDGVPVVLRGEAWPAEDVAASMIRSLVDRVAADERELPERVAVLTPAGWGGYRCGVLGRALHAAELPRAVLCPEAIAIGEHHAARERVDPGEVLAVCALGAGGCRSAVIRRSGSGFEVLGHADAGEPIGGGWFDDALAGHVRSRLGRHATEIDPADPAHRQRWQRLREECTAAKEMLSITGEVSVPVWLVAGQTDVRVTRGEFEKLIEPAVLAVADTVQQALRLAGVTADRLATVLTAGGSAAIPLVSASLSARLRCRVTVAPRPELVAARGAALLVRRAAGDPQAVPLSERHTSLIERAMPAAPAPPLPRTAAQAGAPPERPPIELTPLQLPDRRLSARLAPVLRPAVLGALTVAVVAVSVVLTFVLDAPSPPRDPLHTAPPSGSGQAPPPSSPVPDGSTKEGH